MLEPLRTKLEGSLLLKGIIELRLKVHVNKQTTRIGRARYH